MERTNGLKARMKKAAAAMFLAAALASTGCGQNAVMNPIVDDSAVSEQTANAAGHQQNPAGHQQNP